MALQKLTNAPWLSDEFIWFWHCCLSFQCIYIVSQAYLSLKD